MQGVALFYLPRRKKSLALAWQKYMDYPAFV